MRRRQRRSPKFVRAATSVCVFLVIIVLPEHGDRVRASPLRAVAREFVNRTAGNVRGWRARHAIAARWQLSRDLSVSGGYEGTMALVCEPPACLFLLSLTFGCTCL